MHRRPGGKFVPTLSTIIMLISAVTLVIFIYRTVRREYIGPVLWVLTCASAVGFLQLIISLGGKR